MKPDPAMQIRSMVRSLTETVLPELADSPAARSQTEIVIGSLEMLRQQVDHLRSFAAADVQAQVDLCRELSAVVPGHCGEAMDRARRYAEDAVRDPAVSPSRLDELSGRLRAHVCAVIAAVADDPVASDRVLGLVLRHADGWTARERAWVTRAGFDVFDNTLTTPADASRA